MFDFNDWGSWGVGDFYKGNDTELQDAIKSKKPFDTGWHGFKKELQSMRISRTEDGTKIEVSEYMDEALEETELFCDFLTDEELNLLTDEMIDEIRRLLYEGDFVEDTQEFDILPYDATFEQIMQKASELMNTCSRTLQNSFHECIATTLEIMYHDAPDKEDIIKARIEACN